MATASIWQRPLALEADVAIVGGGVTGAATAQALRELRPDARLVVVEAERLAHGASGRNAGFLLLGTHADYASAVATHGRARARRLWGFTADAFRRAAEIAERHRVGFHACGSVLAAATNAEAERLRQSHVLLAEDGVASHWVSPDALGALGLADYHGALVVSEGGALDPVRWVRALIADSRAHVLEGWPVETVEPDGGRVRLGSGDSCVVAGRVLIAINAWTPALVAEAPVRPVRAQMLATEPVPPILPRPVYSHEGYYYVRQRPDGRIVMGGARHLFRDQEVGLVDETTAPLQAALETALARHVPAAGGARIERRWSGPMGFSPDGLPRLAAVPGVPGAWWAGGFTGHGMGYAARFGMLAARRLLDLPDPDDDLFDAPDVASSRGTARTDDRLGPLDLFL